MLRQSLQVIRIGREDGPTRPQRRRSRRSPSHAVPAGVRRGTVLEGRASPWRIGRATLPTHGLCDGGLEDFGQDRWLGGRCLLAPRGRQRPWGTMRRPCAHRSKAATLDKHGRCTRRCVGDGACLVFVGATTRGARIAGQRKAASWSSATRPWRSCRAATRAGAPDRRSRPRPGTVSGSSTPGSRPR